MSESFLDKWRENPANAQAWIESQDKAIKDLERYIDELEAQMKQLEPKILGLNETRLELIAERAENEQLRMINRALDKVINYTTVKAEQVAFKRKIKALEAQIKWNENNSLKDALNVTGNYNFGESQNEKT